jgi:hypothetical protein
MSAIWALQVCSRTLTISARRGTSGGPLASAVQTRLKKTLLGRLVCRRDWQLSEYAGKRFFAS